MESTEVLIALKALQSEHHRAALLQNLRDMLFPAASNTPPPPLALRSNLLAAASSLPLSYDSVCCPAVCVSLQSADAIALLLISWRAFLPCIGCRLASPAAPSCNPIWTGAPSGSTAAALGCRCPRLPRAYGANCTRCCSCNLRIRPRTRTPLALPPPPAPRPLRHRLLRLLRTVATALRPPLWPVAPPSGWSFAPLCWVCCLLHQRRQKDWRSPRRCLMKRSRQN